MREFAANVWSGLACIAAVVAVVVAIACVFVWCPWGGAGVVVLGFAYFLGVSVRAK